MLNSNSDQILTQNKKLKLCTWNVNGIRAISKKGFLEWFELERPDILCLQETKADSEAMKLWWNSHKNQNPIQKIKIKTQNFLYSSIPSSIFEDTLEKDISNSLEENAKFDSEDSLFVSNGVSHIYNTSIFANYTLIWNSCSIKKGYSGTAILFNNQKLEQLNSQTTLGLDEFDREGRTSIFETKDFVLVNCYYPQGGRSDRIPYKLNFYQEIINLVTRLKQAGKKVILCGDMNTTRQDIDLARPNQNRKTTGCLPEERKVLEDLINLGCHDTFRHFYPELGDKYTYWDQITRARDRNVGWRIDYFLVDTDLLPNLLSCTHLDQVFGSDHCPVEIILQF
jgi:exodeoxyribonuclease III